MVTPVVRSWPVPIVLVLLGALPLLAGVLRLIQLAGGPAVIAADARLDPAPLVVVHVIGATMFVLLGAVQFVPGLRRGAWHRRAGRWVAAAGLVVAASALTMTLVYPARPGTGELLFVLRLVFGSALAAFLVLGVSAARRKDLAAHRAWMIRAYAVALAAGTQPLTETLGPVLFGHTVLVHDLSSGAGWLLNLAVGECIIRFGAVRTLSPGGSAERAGRAGGGRRSPRA
ncbi:DUF2306 domain-containing protein [Pseudonocardia sp. WMMC193]|uniref:DUF2306 domain-containing protein n=1 Tax=Pseudonocardia sp. WMMC193 TaxID=2911965 RepID=UPI001F3184B2|nr:DUF2306 domain-containing protein [Pseudonocardia sp. WMMC193]MCF7550696.1 DUF2306 domain-containing protein [Pseudonocardia sp. WMMC193]